MEKQFNEQTNAGQVVENQYIVNNTNVTINNIEMGEKTIHSNKIVVGKSKLAAIMIGILILGGAATGGVIHWFGTGNSATEPLILDSDLEQQEIEADDVKLIGTALAPGVGEVKVFDQETDYVINTSTMVIHDPSCTAVTEMAYANLKEIEEEDYDAALDSGYELCKRCLDKKQD